MMKKQIVALAFASLCSTASFGMLEGEEVPISNGGFGGSWGDGMGGGGDWGTGGFGGGSLGSAAFEAATLPPVTVNCSKVMCGTTSTFYGGTMMTTIGQGPLSPLDRDANPPEPLTPEQQEEQKRKCLDACDISNKVNLNMCTQGVARLNDQIRYRPVLAAMGGAVAGAAAGGGGPKSAGGAVAGAYIAWQMAKTSNAEILANYTTNCLATAARDNNLCIQQTCHAWFLGPLLLLRRRREDDTATA